VTDERPLVILQPAPQRPERIFTPAARQELETSFRVVDLSDDHDPGSFDAVLPGAFAIIGQPDLPAERLARATALRAICNVEGNFFPNVDYADAFARGIHVLGCGPAYAQAVGEYALGLALDVARGIRRTAPSGPAPSATWRTATPTPSCCAGPGSA
jgi:phosphoglycerate dehydrogenase-like enzyme